MEEGNLDNYIYFLRRRLKSVGSRIQLKTVRGIGLPHGGLRYIICFAAAAAETEVNMFRQSTPAPYAALRRNHHPGSYFYGLQLSVYLRKT